MDALSNLNSIRADVIEVWDAGSLSYKTIQETIVGLPPATLNSIELLASAIGNDPGFFEAVSTGLAAKADTSSVESELASRDTAIATKASSVELTSELTTRDTTIATKASTVELESQLATVNTALESKASSTDVVEELALIDTALGSKVSSVTLASELATRDTALAGKASATELTSQISTVTAAVALKASATELTSQISTVTAAVALKASTAVLTSQLATRDTAIALKASSAVLASELTTRDSAITAIELSLAQREAAFTATAPLQKVISGGGIALRINPAADVVAAAFQSGKFRLQSPSPGSVELQRFDDDGASPSNLWQNVARFRWNSGVVGGLMQINAFRGIDAAAVLCQDNLNIQNDLHIGGNLTCNGTTPNPYWVACNCIANGTISFQKGQYAIMVSKRGGDIAYDVSFPAHPEGDKYIVSISSNEYHAFYRSHTSTGFILYLRGSTNGIVAQGDGSFNIAILK